MKKNELSELLQTINNHYWGKISEQLNNKDFLETWYEALKDYDYDLIKIVYSEYSDTQFPPTAKYFSLSCEQANEDIAEEIRQALNNMWQWSTDEYMVAKQAMNTYIAKFPWDKKSQTIQKVERDFVSATREGRLSLKEWLYERGM